MKQISLCLLIALSFQAVPVAFGQDADAMLTPSVRQFVEESKYHYLDNFDLQADGDATDPSEPDGNEVVNTSERLVEYKPVHIPEGGYDGFFKTLFFVIKWILIVGCITVAGFLLFKVVMFFWNKRGLLPENKGKANASDAYERQYLSDSIFDHNFGIEIDTQFRRGDFNGAIRLLYLQTLAVLNQNKQIVWNESKTPTEYYYELKRVQLKPMFHEMTSVFLTVRYGNVQATELTFQRMSQLCKSITKFVTPVISEHKL